MQRLNAFATSGKSINCLRCGMDILKTAQLWYRFILRHYKFSKHSIESTAILPGLVTIRLSGAKLIAQLTAKVTARGMSLHPTVQELGEQITLGVN